MTKSLPVVAVSETWWCGGVFLLNVSRGSRREWDPGELYRGGPATHIFVESLVMYNSLFILLRQHIPPPTHVYNSIVFHLILNYVRCRFLKKNENKEATSSEWWFKFIKRRGNNNKRGTRAAEMAEVDLDSYPETSRLFWPRKWKKE